MIRRVHMPVRTGDSRGAGAVELSVTDRVGLLVAVMLLSAGCAGTSTERFCTLAGCDSGLSVHLEEFVWAHGDELPAVAEACVDGECASETVDLARYGVGFREPERSGPEVVDVTLTVTDDDGEILVDLRENAEYQINQPNGPDCEPTCWQASVSYDGETGELRSPGRVSPVPENKDRYADCPCPGPWEIDDG